MRRFVSGAKKFKKTLALTHEDMSSAQCRSERNDSEYFVPKDINPSQLSVNRAAAVEEREMNSFLGLLSEGGTGYIGQEKRPGWIRVMFENYNSIGIGTQDWKMDRLNQMIKDLSIDVVSGCETNVDWRQSNDGMLDLMVPAMGKKGLTAHNTTGDLLHKACLVKAAPVTLLRYHRPSL